MKSAAQAELFSKAAQSADSNGEWRAIEGYAEYRYRELPNGSLEIDFGNGDSPVIATMQSAGKGSRGNPRYWLDHPRLGVIQRRGKGGFLKIIAGMMRIFELQQQALKKNLEATEFQNLALRETEAVTQMIGEHEAREPRPRTANKLSKSVNCGRGEAKGYVNPFLERWNHSQSPDWFERERGPSDLTKRVFGRLLFPPDVCARYDKFAGIVYEPNIAWLAKALGSTDNGVRKAMVALEEVWKVIQCVKLENGRILELRFLNHEWLMSWRLENEAITRARESRKALFKGPNAVEPAPNGIGAKPQQCSGFKRDREQEKKDNESSARRSEGSGSIPIRVLSNGEGTKGHYARWYDKDSENSWVELCQYLGRAEMDRSGAMWLGRYEMKRDLLESVLRRGKREEAENGPPRNRGRVLNAIWMEQEPHWA